MAIWCWVKPFKIWMKQSLREAGFSEVDRWFEQLKSRPGLRAGVEVMREVAKGQQQHRESKEKLSEKIKKNLFLTGGAVGRGKL